MIHVRQAIFGLGILATLAAPARSAAYPLTVERDTVIPVIFEDDLSIKESRVGDRFRARVDGTAVLPPGTRLMGRILSIHRANGDRPAYMDLEFTDILLPSGEGSRISAIPIPLDDKYVTRDRDGRIVVKPDYRKRTNYVLGGAVGGLLAGSIIKKPVEGAIAGILGGIIAAESDKGARGELAVQHGQKLGALVEREFAVDVRSPREGRRRDRTWSDDGRIDRDGDRGDRPSDRDRADRDEPAADRDARELTLRIGDHQIRFGRDEQPYRDGETVMVPLKSVAEQLGYEVETGSGGRIYLEDKDSLLKLSENARDYSLNGRRGTLPRDTVEKDGIVYVPLEIFIELRREDVFVNDRKVSERG